MKSIHVGQFETIEDVPEKFKSYAEAIVICQKINSCLATDRRIKYVGLALQEMIDRFLKIKDVDGGRRNRPKRF